MVKSVVKISGMTCGACSSAVTSALQAVPGVTSADVSVTTETGVVEHSPEVTTEQLITAIEDAGFDAEIDETACDKTEQIDLARFQVFGMTCSACSTSIENNLRSLEGVVNADVNLTTEQAIVKYDTTKLGIRTILTTIEDTGFDATVATFGNDDAQLESLQKLKEIQSYRQDTIRTLILGLPIILISKLGHWGLLPAFVTATLIPGLHVDDVLCFLLVTPIQFVIAQRFYIKTYKSLKAQNLNMDVLVTLSTTSAYTYSVIALVNAVALSHKGHDMYLWDASAMIILFVLFGKYLESMARGNTSQALSSLIALVPDTATIVESTELGESERQIGTELLQVGDIILLKPGEKVAADGEVVYGESYITESMLTGEPEPVQKTVGSLVTGGTVNNQGSLKFRVTRAGSQTKLAQIVEFVKDAQAAKAPIQRYADYVVSKFVGAVILLALLTFLFWMVISHTMHEPPLVFQNAPSKFFVCFRLCISVIVVACPCALGLATPTAVMVASGVGAQNGILVKSGGVFESLSHVNAVLFDKTGTITLGKMTVKWTDIPLRYWPLIATAERQSEHATGSALVDYAETLEVSWEACQASGFEAIVGRGISAQIIHGTEVFDLVIGSQKFMQEKEIIGAEKPELNSTAVRGMESMSRVFVSVNGELVGSATLEDQIRSEAAEVVEQLQNQGVLVGLVSGDSQAATEKVAAQIGIPLAMTWAEATPTAKVDVIRGLQDQGRQVAMVGDGINDSPALVCADVGISLEGASHVAVEAADVVLVKQNPIVGIPATLDLGRRALQRIKFNLFASLIYNVLMIPLSMGVLLPFGIMMNPLAASLAMALSSVSVVLSSLTLRRWTPPRPEQLQPNKASWWQRIFPGQNPDYIPLQTV